MAKTITLPAKKTTMSTKEYQALKETALPAPTESHEEIEPTQNIMHISMATYVASLASSIMSYKHAIMLECATGLAIMCERGAADRYAKRTLASVYAAAGYDTSESTGKDYKSTQRKIGIIASLFSFVGAEKVKEWVGGNSEGAAISAIAKGLEPFQLKNWDGINALLGKPRIAAKASAPVIEQAMKEQPAQQVETKKQPEPVPQANAQEVLEPGEIRIEEPSQAPSAASQELPEDQEGPRWMRRLNDKPENIFKTVDTEHIHIALSKEVDRTEIINAAMSLLKIAEDMNNGIKGDKEVEGALQAELKKIKASAQKQDEQPLKAELQPKPEPMHKPRGRRVAR